MRFRPEDFEFDYVDKNFAARRAQELFDAWVKLYNVCTHPAEKIRLPKSGYEFSKCAFKCLCGVEIKMSIDEVTGLSSPIDE